MWRLRDYGERSGMGIRRSLGSGVGRLLGRVWARIEKYGEGNGDVMENRVIIGEGWVYRGEHHNILIDDGA